MRSTARIKPPGKTQAERDLIAIGVIESYMDSISKKHMACPTCKKQTKVKDLSPAAATLMRARYDKLRPSLSAVEQTIVNNADQVSEGDIVRKLQELVQAHPDLIRSLLGSLPAASPVALPDADSGDSGKTLQ